MSLDNRYPTGVVYSEDIDLSALDWALSAATKLAFGPPDAIMLCVAAATNIDMKLARSTTSMVFALVSPGVQPFSPIEITRATTGTTLRAANTLKALWYAKGV